MNIKEKPEIVFIHSLNNYTGSPNVLSVVLRGFVTRGYRVKLYTSRGAGFLSNISGVEYRYTCYRWNENKVVTLFWLLMSQLSLFFRLLFASNKLTYYINTIIPFGALWACKLSGKRYVVHVHENMQQKKLIYPLLRGSYARCNTKSIFVSQYLQGTAVNCREGKVIPNALSPDFLIEASTYILSENRVAGNEVLMVASLRRFKGIYEFVALAKRLPDYLFTLVLGATEEEVARFKEEIGDVKNLTLYSAQRNVHPFYRKAKVLLQLSQPEACVETFGLTILEAMAYGVPAIVPTMGGPTELVDEGVNGYCISCHEEDRVAETLMRMMVDSALYAQLSAAALRRSANYTEEKLLNQLEKYIP